MLKKRLKCAGGGARLWRIWAIYRLTVAAAAGLLSKKYSYGRPPTTPVKNQNIQNNKACTAIYASPFIHSSEKPGFVRHRLQRYVSRGFRQHAGERSSPLHITPFKASIARANAVSCLTWLTPRAAPKWRSPTLMRAPRALWAWLCGRSCRRKAILRYPH